MSGDKHELARITMRPELMHSSDAALQIMLKQAVAAAKCRVGCFRQHRRISVAVGLGGPAVVDARKILRMPIDHIPADAPFDRIYSPTLERAARSIRPQQTLGEHAIVGDRV